MENTKMAPEQNRGRRNPLSIPFLIALAGVLMMVISLFLPYMSASGDLAAYIEKYPDRVEVESLGLTASDLANVSVVSVRNMVTGVYSEADGAITTVIVLVFGVCLALTALFVVLRKPVAIIIFNLLACGVFFFLNFLLGKDFIAADKYAWGIGYYTIVFAAVVIFVGAVWMLVKKVQLKKQEKAITSSNVQQ